MLRREFYLTESKSEACTKHERDEVASVLTLLSDKFNNHTSAEAVVNRSGRSDY